MTAISGYRQLSEGEISDINALKALGQGVLVHLEYMARPALYYDQRWISIAKTHLQQAIMAGVRAIAKPEGV